MGPSEYNSAQPLQFANLDQLLWGIVKTLQYYSLPAMVFLVMSGDDTDRKSKLKGWIINILVGGLLVFGAASLAQIIKTFVGGSA